LGGDTKSGENINDQAHHKARCTAAVYR